MILRESTQQWNRVTVSLIHTGTVDGQLDAVLRKPLLDRESFFSIFLCTRYVEITETEMCFVREKAGEVGEYCSNLRETKRFRSVSASSRYAFTTAARQDGHVICWG